MHKLLLLQYWYSEYII